MEHSSPRLTTHRADNRCPSFPSNFMDRDQAMHPADAPLTPPPSAHSEDSQMDSENGESEFKYDDLDEDVDSDEDMDDEPAGMRRQSHQSIASSPVAATALKPPPLPLRALADQPCHLQPPGSLKLTDFAVKGTLGTGTFAKVLLVHSTTPGTPRYYALKVLRKAEIVRLRQVEHVNAERYILSRVHHPFVVDLFATFQDSMNIYMLLSYVPGGELFTHLRRAGRFTPDVTRFYMANIVLALKHLHSFNIIYRDLKPENLLLDSLGYLRIADFGFAKIVDDRTWTLCGTPEYLSPEIIQSDGHGKPADWWACGILCYEMLVGYPPFFHETAYGIYEKILAGHVHWPSDMDRLSRDLIKAFLHPDRTKRLGDLIGGPQDILDHPWFRGVDWDALERQEIRAPIIPPQSSESSSENFMPLPLPPSEDMPGLLREERPPALEERFHPSSYQFLDF